MQLIKSAAIAAASALFVFIPAAGHAQGVLGGPDSSWYAGGSIGQSSNDLCSTAFLGGTCDDSDTAYRIFVGYPVNLYVCLERGYHQLGEVKLPSGPWTLTMETKAFDLVAVGTLPLTERLGLYGRLGLYRASTDFSSSTPGIAIPNQDNTGLTYG